MDYCDTTMPIFEFGLGNLTDADAVQQLLDSFSASSSSSSSNESVDAFTPLGGASMDTPNLAFMALHDQMPLAFDFEHKSVMTARGNLDAMFTPPVTRVSSPSMQAMMQIANTIAAESAICEKLSTPKMTPASAVLMRPLASSANKHQQAAADFSAMMQSSIPLFMPLASNPKLKMAKPQQEQQHSAMDFSAAADLMKPRVNMLSGDDLERLFVAANGHSSSTRSKRDVAILCLIFDAHFSSSTITKLTFQSIPSLLRAVQSGDSSLENHIIEIADGESNVSRHLCHPFTAWAIKEWLMELAAFGWSLSDPTNPVFVNSQPVCNSDSGEKRLRRMSLKRDAITKVFNSVRSRAGVPCHKQVTAVTTLQPVEDRYAQWIARFPGQRQCE